MKNRSLVLTVSLIAMMIVGVAHGAQIASTDYVTKSVGDEADLVWTAIDSINNETTGVLATAKSYTDGEITSAMEEVADAIPTDNAELTNGAGYITSAALPTKVSELTNDTGFITSADIPDAPTVDDALSSTSTNAVQNKVVTAALDGKLGKDEKAASAATADSATTAGTATSATQDASGNVITETYATKGELSSGLSGKLDTNGSIEIAQVTGLSDALAQAGSQLNEAQTAAVNSGITQAKVEAYDAYAGQIASKADASAIPTDNAQLTNGAGYITAEDIPDAPTVDDALSSTSTNAVQNKVVTAALDGKLDTTGSIEISQVNGLSDALAQAGSQLNEAQTAAVNSGITQAKVEAYDAYAGQIASKADASAIPTNNNQLTNGAGYITAADIPDAPTVDDALSSTSTNAVQNKVVTAALDGKLGKNEKAASAATADSATTAGSATKATQDASGNVITETYALKTAIPTNNNQLTNGANYITAASLPGAATASAAGIMKWGQIPSGSATATTSATIWVQ